MAIDEVRASGLEYVAVATELLRRVRLTDAEAGLWEAADLQWWWRTPRRSDAIDQLFWVDDEGPVAGVVLTDWGRAWGCDLILVPSAKVPLAAVWTRAVEAIDGLGLEAVEMLARDDDLELRGLLAGAGFVADDERSGITPDGEAAGYALFWFDPVTKVGLVEPMRVEGAYQRRGLARAMLSAGLDRLAKRGANRMKVGYGTEVGRRLYCGAGFRVTSTDRSYRWTKPVGRD